MSELASQGGARTTRAERSGKGGRKTQDQRRLTAFRAFLEILDTADWIRHEIRPQLRMFDVSMEELRCLEMLHSAGRVTMRQVAERRHCTKQSAANLVEGLRKRGWAEYEVERLTRVPDRKGDQRRGWRIGYIKLNAEGHRFIRAVLPRNMKLVLAFMRALEWREQEALIRSCKKLRDGNILRFLREMEYG
jgi:DNA-binding MarR family transcriptional regulator